MLGISLFIVCIAVCVPAFAQNSKLAGDYTGMLGPYHVKLHLVVDQSGMLTGTAQNQEMGLSGNCEKIRAEGQALSFTIPAVQGTWTGLVSADYSTLSGLWSQGASPMPLNFTRDNGAPQTSAAVPAGSAPSQPVPSPNEATGTAYVFNPLPGGTVTQVYQNGSPIGNIMTLNGQVRVIVRSGIDSAKVQKAYQDYLAANAGAAPAGITPVAPGAQVLAGTAAPAVGAGPASLGFSNNGKADPAGIKFDGNTVTVPRTDGMTVVFAGDDVTIAEGTAPAYVLRRKKASVGRAVEQALDHSHAAAGGIAGGGVEFLRAGGGLIYDSGMGGYNVQESPGIRQAKQLALIAMDAINAVRQMPGHSDFKPSGYNALKEVSTYKLRSDGSR